MKSWCPTHGDVTACPCRPVPKKYLAALTRNWYRASHYVYVTVSGAVQLRPYKPAGQSAAKSAGEPRPQNGEDPV